MKLSELLLNYVELNYIDDQNLAVRRTLNDIKISDTVFARIIDGNVKIIYLHSGSTVYIPSELYLLFSRFNTLHYNEVQYNGSNIISNGSDCSNIDKFIYYFSRLVRQLDTKEVDKLLNTLVNVIQIGTSDINNLLRGKLGNERIDTTIEYSSPNNFLDI